MTPFKKPAWFLRTIMGETYLKDVPPEYCPVLSVWDIADLIKKLPDKLKIDLGGANDDNMYYIEKYSKR